MKATKLYDWTSIIDFGRHKNETLEAVFQKSPSYINWCFQAVDTFCVTDEIFEKLPIVISLKADSSMSDGNTQKDWLEILKTKHEQKKQQLQKQQDHLESSSHSKSNRSEYTERESSGEYAGSYAQDVEGLSDDFIDDAFGGDPDAYWNID